MPVLTHSDRFSQMVTNIIHTCSLHVTDAVLYDVIKLTQHEMPVQHSMNADPVQH